MKKLIYNILIVFAGLSAFSCDDFLDEIPDNRTLLDTPDKIKELMVTSYPLANYALIAELSADNILDNQAPVNGISLSGSSFDRMDTEIFEWKDIKSSDGTDSPYFVWELYYQSIAAANHVLEAIEKLKTEGLSDENMDPQKGEALLLRAYSHFILVNIFAKTYKDPVNSAKDLGITYITDPEKKVIVHYERNSVAEVYDLIAKDIEEGLPLIDDRSYDIPKYHFTTSAAHAFASQFYLYKRDYNKAIEHANAVLGTGNPSSLLRDWITTYTNSETELNVYISSDSPANLLIIPTFSTYKRRFVVYRYSWNGTATKGTDDGGPTWSNRPPFLQGWLWTNDPNYGAFHAKIRELFEYTDKIASIGYPHIVRTEFTTDDVLLNRAEAKIMLGNIDDAVKDLQYWNVSHKATRELTKEAITGWYTKDENRKAFVFPFHTTELSPEFIVTEVQKPYIDCVLHFRRLERIFEGHRWFDIKRYGIEVTHVAGRSGTKLVLTYDDDRRAIQIPSDVVGAGLEPNPRPTTAPNDEKVVQLANPVDNE
jgi:tetratricopeptide (TPR) repeat protein